jgi:hypothetical protein
MSSTAWVAITSLLGVLVGGAISLFTQRLTERSASIRHTAMILEGRRSERLLHLNTFIEAAQEAERLALRLYGPNKKRVPKDQMDLILDQLWVKLRAVQLLCPDEISQAARELAGRAHTAVRHGVKDQSITDFLRPCRDNLITKARMDLDRF